jgi:hypothetical protein
METMPNVRRLVPVACLALCLLAGAAHTAEDRAEAIKAELEKLTGGSFRITAAGVTAVVSDSKDEVAALVAKHLHQALPRMRALAQIPRDAPVPEQIVVALFAKKSDCDKFLKARGSGEFGRYNYLYDKNPKRCVIAGFELDSRPMLARLRHEAMEALLRAYIPDAPAWVTLGLGEAMEDVVVSDDGGIVFGPPRGHLRDLRERVFQTDPSPLLPLKELIGRSPDEFEKGGFASGLQAWSFVRFLLEDPLPREAKLMGKLYAALDPKAGEKENGKHAYEFFVEDEWGSIEKAWKLYLAKLVETPADKVYRDAREALNKKDYEAARPLLDQAAKADPDYERIYYYRALCGFHTDKQGAAASDLDTALAIFPEYHAARFLRGRVRAAMGDAPGAKQDFEGCLGSPYREMAKKQLEALK